MKINRYSCRCKLCKARWTTAVADRTEAFTAHEFRCTLYPEVFAKRRGMYPQFSEASERYQMSALYFEHRRIEGHLVPDVKCDGRCMGATGHVCDCSCGGSNHGIGAMA